MGPWHKETVVANSEGQSDWIAKPLGCQESISGCADEHMTREE